MDNNLNNFKVHPANDFEAGLNGKASGFLGQAHIENSDNLPVGFADRDYFAKVSIDVLDEKDAKTLKNNIQGIIALATMTAGNSIEPFKNLYAIDIQTEGKTVSAFLKFDRTFLQNLNVPDIDLMQLIGIHGLNLNVEGKLGFNPVFILTKPFMEFLETCFDISVQSSGDEIIRYIFTMVENDLRKQADIKNDVISHNLTLPFCDFIANYINNTNKIEFDQTYDRDNLKNTIFEYNVPNGSFVNEIKGNEELQAYVNGFLQRQIQEISKGFFGVYLKVLNTINYDTIKFVLGSQYKVCSIFAEINIPGATQYVQDNVVCYLKK